MSEGCPSLDSLVQEGREPDLHIHMHLHIIQINVSSHALVQGLSEKGFIPPRYIAIGGWTNKHVVCAAPEDVQESDIGINVLT